VHERKWPLLIGRICLAIVSAGLLAFGAIVAAAQKFFDAGFTDLALVQIGADQQDSFFEAATGEILPELRKL